MEVVNPVRQAVELVLFSLKPDTDEVAFLALNATVQTYIDTLPGFVYRALCKQSDGIWQDIVFWQDRVAALHAQQLFMKSEACVTWLAMIDPASINMQHSEVMFAKLAERLAS
tara:strand:+ start:436 stop:774 length:339 start_codon:yes stop_codon:yes gene_type:complete